MFLCGLSKDKKKLGWSVFEVSALLCMVFFILKLFPIWPGFNKLVGSLPILRQCWFIVYFMPIFLWGFACFSARGAEKVFYHNDQGIKVEVVLSFFVVLLLFAKGILNTEN